MTSNAAGVGVLILCSIKIVLLYGVVVVDTEDIQLMDLLHVCQYPLSLSNDMAWVSARTYYLTIVPLCFVNIVR